MPDIPTPVSDAAPNRPKRARLWLWFVVGFVAVFLALAAVYPLHFYDGRSVRQVGLWQYYLLELQLVVNSSGSLGPTSGHRAAALATALGHLAVSAVGGTVAMAISWVSQKRRK